MVIRKVQLQKRILILGFGSIGQAILPLLFRHLIFQPEQITIISKDNEGLKIAQQFQVNFHHQTITEENYYEILGGFLQEGDFLLNLSLGVSSVDLIKLCQEKGALYLDTCSEPWDGIYLDGSIAPALRTNYALREEVLKLKDKAKKTAVITHGANPGLVSHFVKQALLNMANDTGIAMSRLETATDWAELAHRLEIKSIHIAEHDTQTTRQPKKSEEFVNTWSVDGLISEGLQPAELGWGTHERHWPRDAEQHKFGPKCAIYLKRPGAATLVRTWTPLGGACHGFLITHAEAISLANYLTLQDDQGVYYRPTVHYAYNPCPDAVLSLYELSGNYFEAQEKKRLIVDEVMEGIDELGVLLMGNSKGAYWYGSQLSIQTARDFVPYNNATSLQVASGTLAGVLWALEHPDCGIVEPEDLDYRYVLDIAEPYLGNLGGYYTDWTPLQKRSELFAEAIDHSDPWQFLNIRVN
ncbi:homospermidine synthase [Legionella beliardensis]|uniref:Homospermidine synthase n=1 Tax=Legionella beliardensis TaxID=91822 RepID=A0A378I5Q9_9GAMM|nr:saccharopine dehydrogenase NADP-binding domain-containing protein [Legionella beliardensis]STX29991.1 homospermidine synthase [Legionella beliardensis]